MKFLFIVLVFLIQCKTLTPSDNFDPDYGDIEGNIYESKKGKFVCYVPVDARDAVMEDGNFKVSFFQKDLGLYKVQAINLTSDLKNKIVEQGKESVFKNFIQDQLIQKIKPSYPKIQISSSIYSADFRDGTYFFLLSLGNDSQKIQNDKLPYSNYAMMIFSVGDFLYLITRDSIQFDSNEAIQKKNLDLIQEDAISRLLDFHSRIAIVGDLMSSDLALEAFDAEIEIEDEGLEEGGSSSSIGGEIDLSGIIKILQTQWNANRGRFNIRPGRFKFDQRRFNTNRLKMSGRTHIKPGRFKVKSSFKSRGFKR
ncbi:MAG: hypothetical protein O9264_04485 [Leptospira sp.]|nr:hypothetical protein [Leptospira sp.]